MSCRTIQRIEKGDSSNLDNSLERIANAIGYPVECITEGYTINQYKAVKSDSGNLLIIAGAGAGKTKVVTGIINDSIKNRNVNPSEIMTITYTEKAAEEMKIRTTNILEKESLFAGKSDMSIGTIHSCCMQLLDKYTNKFKGFTVLSPIQLIHFINKHWNQIGVDKIKRLDKPEYNLIKYKDTKLFISMLNIIGENEVIEEEIPDEIKSAIYNYRDLLFKNKYFDFTSIQIELLNELKNNEEFKSQIRKNIKYLIVDEYQDVNYIQESIIWNLNALGVKLTVVGDEDQCIYSFRGSEIGYILGFEDKYNNVEVINLEENFRSTNGIVDLASIVVSNNSKRRNKNIEAYNTSYEKGDITYKWFDKGGENYNLNKEDEEMFICNRIEDLIELGIRPDNIAILVRKNSMADGITNKLQNKGIKYQVSNVNKLLETRECELAKGIFEYINNKDEKALRSLIKNIGMDVRDENIDKAISALENWDKDIWSSTKKPYQEYLLQSIYQEFIEAIVILEEDNNEKERVFYNLGKFSQLIDDYERIYFNTPPNIKISSFCKFLEYGAEDYYPEGYLDNKYINQDAVKVMTIHQSKGLEFTAVFIPGLTNNIFPIKRKGGISEWHFIPKQSIKNFGTLKGLDHKEDERRLFYVAATRSKKFLFLTGAQYNKQSKKESAFIKEALEARGYIFEFDEGYNYLTTRPRYSDDENDSLNIIVNFSEISNYITCPYKYKLLVNYGFRQPISFRMGYGNSMHNIVREINDKALKGDLDNELNDKVINEIINNNFHLNYIGALKEVEKDMKEKAFKATKKYLQKNKKDFQCIQSVEKNIEIPLKNGVSLVGRIDVVLKKDLRGLETVHIVDYKTGDSSSSNKEHEIQTNVYSLGYFKEAQKEPDFMEVYDLDSTEVISSKAVNKSGLVKVEEVIFEATEAIKNNNLVSFCGGDHCKKCYGNMFCSYYKNLKN